MEDKSIENAKQIVDFHPQITSYLSKLVDSFNKGKLTKVTNQFKIVKK